MSLARKAEWSSYKEFAMSRQEEYEEFYKNFIKDYDNKNKEKKESKEYREEYNKIKELAKKLEIRKGGINEMVEKIIKKLEMNNLGTKKTKKKRVMDYINKGKEVTPIQKQ